MNKFLVNQTDIINIDIEKIYIAIIKRLHKRKTLFGVEKFIKSPLI